MTPERWEAVKEIVRGALDRPPGERARFLDEACTNDVSLRQEVESLLSAEKGSFLEKSPLDEWSGAEPPTASFIRTSSAELAGRTLSHYRVIDEVSRGGMGVVYRALDVRLAREVALKVLPPELTAHSDRKLRFLQEARAAAALEHPHIAVVHEVDEAESVTFIAMELIEGEKLRDLLGRGRLGLDRSLDLAVEIVEGLSHAHEKGIVHRDLKPANIMVTADGHAKIIDFGLAKLIGPLAGEATREAERRAATGSGIVMGTLSYMSPEQARGEKVDHRSDLFTFGIVLYEMLTGELPFKAPSGAEIPHALIHDPTPRLSASTGAAREKLQAVLDRCLAKRPEDRFPSARDLLVDLREVRRSLLLQAATPARGGRVPLALVGAGVLAIGLVTMVILQPWKRLAGETGVLVLERPVQVTSAVGVEDFPAWSPDGKSLAYHSNQSGNSDIWVVQVGGGEPLNRTAGYTGDDRYPSWSPDGREIAFWSEREGKGFYVMSALAGAPRRIASAEALGPAHWSRDGTTLTFLGRDTEGALFKTISLVTGEVLTSLAPGRSENRIHASFSPDERLVAYMDAAARNSLAHPLVLLRRSDQKAFTLTDGKSRVWNASWSPDGSALYFAASDQGGSMDLWQQSITKEGEPKGVPERVTTGMGIRAAALSPDGKTLVYSQGRRIANVYRTPILADRPATWADAEQVTFDQSFIGFVSVSSDRRHILFNSDRGGNQDLWMMPIARGEMRRLTIDPAPDWSPVTSPDMKSICFYSSRSGNREIWTMPLDGGPARQVTFHEGEDYHPDWSPDGKQIVFTSTRSGDRELWVVSAEGGEPRRLTASPGFDQFPKWSPDGKWIIFVTTRLGPYHLFRVPAEGGEAQRLTEGPAGYARFSYDGTRIVFIGMNERSGNIWTVSVPGGDERALTQLGGRPGNLNELALATDGKNLFFTWDDDLGDLWAMDVVRR